MNQQQSPAKTKLLQITIIIGSIFIIIGLAIIGYLFIVRKPSESTPVSIPKPELKEIYKTLAKIQAIDLDKKIITIETFDYSKLKTIVEEEGQLMMKLQRGEISTSSIKRKPTQTSVVSQLIITDSTRFSNTALSALNPNDLIIIETKENLLESSLSILTAVSIDKDLETIIKK